MNYIPLETKIMTAEDKIIDWHRFFDGKVYVGFSGGKDSTVLLNLVRNIYPDVPAVFCDTGLEFPEIREFVKTVDNVVWLKPKIKPDEVVKKYGYPIVSKQVAHSLRQLMQQNLSDKHRNKLMYGDEKGNAGKVPEKFKFLLNAPFKISDMCCDKLKKEPFKIYEKNGRKPYIGVMAYESNSRLRSWKKYGCNAFEMSNPQSRPLMPWTEEDIKDYIKEFNIKISDIYSMGYERTGCMFCGFGSHLKKKDNFELLQKTHPKQYDYIMNKMGFKEVLAYLTK